MARKPPRREGQEVDPHRRRTAATSASLGERQPGPLQTRLLNRGDGFERPLKGAAALHLHHGEDAASPDREIDLHPGQAHPEPEDAVAPGHQPESGDHLRGAAVRPRADAPLAAALEAFGASAHAGPSAVRRASARR